MFRRFVRLLSVCLIHPRDFHAQVAEIIAREYGRDNEKMSFWWCEM